MSSIGPNMRRIHSQREFQDSLNALNQLSQGDSSHNSSNSRKPQAISWEEVAKDVESFLAKNKDISQLDQQKFEK